MKSQPTRTARYKRPSCASFDVLSDRSVGTLRGGYLRMEKLDPSSCDKMPFAAGPWLFYVSPIPIVCGLVTCCGNCGTDTEWVHATADSSQESQQALRCTGQTRSKRVARDRLTRRMFQDVDTIA